MLHPPGSTPSACRKGFYGLLLLVFLDLMGFGMLLPDVQLRAERLGAPGWMIGLILASMFLVQSLVSPIWGRISDRTGAKTVILACTAFSILAMLVYTQATVVWILFLSRGLAGLGAANVAAAQAAAVQGATAQERTERLGKVGAALSAGLIVGAASGGFIEKAGGPVLLGGAAAICSFVGLLAVLIFVPNRQVRLDREATRFDLRTILRERGVLLVLFFVSTIGWFSLACLEGTFGRLLSLRYGEGQIAFGLIFAMESVISVSIQAWFIKRAVDRLGERKLLVVAFLLQGAGLALVPFAPTVAMVAFFSIFYAVGSAYLNPAIYGWCSRATPEERQGTVFGLLQSTRSVGFVIGPILGGILFDWRYSAPYLLAGLVSLIAIAVLLFATRQDRQGCGPDSEAAR